MRRRQEQRERERRFIEEQERRFFEPARPFPGMPFFGGGPAHPGPPGMPGFMGGDHDLYPGGFREDGKASVGAYLRYTGDRPCLELRLRLSVVDQRGGPDVAWRSGLALLGTRARLDQGVVTNWGSARLVPRVWLTAGNEHPGLVVDDCVRFRVDVMILGKRRGDVNPLGGLALPLAREVVGAPITPVKRRSIVSPMKGRAR